MTGDAASTVPLFATPFAAVNTGADRDFNARVAASCDSLAAAARTPLHFQGPEDFLDVTDPVAGELRRLVVGLASKLVGGMTRLDAAEFGRLHVQARGWCCVVQRNGHVPARHHPGAAWLAVYCVRAGAPDAEARSAGVLRLCERRLASIYRDASTADLRAPYRYGNHTWTPLPGWLALFPAHVPHEVSVVRSDTPLTLVFAMLRFTDPAAGPAAEG